MDLLQPINAAPLRAPQPAQGPDRGPRAVTPPGQGAGSQFSADRQPAEAAPHGAVSRPMFMSLLSDGTLGVLRQMLFGAQSYRIDDSAPGRATAAARQPGAQGGEEAPARRDPAHTVTESFTFSFLHQDIGFEPALKGMVRRASAAYAQAFAASPAFPFARPAETVNLVA